MTRRIVPVEPQGRAIWVFAYGSLMWDPGFPFEARAPALVRGYHRAFCVASRFYRGTEARPGLVLGLVRGGSCRGFAYRIAPGERDGVMAYLEAREMSDTYEIYRCRRLKATLAAQSVHAYGFVVDTDHELYAGRLPREVAAARILVSAGERGANRAYLAETVRHLDELGLSDTSIHALHDAVERLAQSRDETSVNT